METENRKKLEKRSKDIEEDMRGLFFRDQTKIIHSLAFRRLKDKTQVLSDPTDDHICTRVEHVLHVATVAKSICKGLNQRENSGFKLDEDLAFAIGLGHDLGHAPFGHAGEKALDNLLGDGIKFMHELHSYRVVEQLECLNLTYAVKDGIICHNGENYEQCIKPRTEFEDLSTFTDRKQYPITYEGCIVRFSDKIAYLGRDIEDALRSGLINEKDLTDNIKKRSSLSNQDIISYLVKDLVDNSSKDSGICFSDEAHAFMEELRDFSINKIYANERIVKYKKKCDDIILFLFNHLIETLGVYNWDTRTYQDGRTSRIDDVFLDYLKDMRNVYKNPVDGVHYLYVPKNDISTMNRIVVDFIAGMTDRFALKCFEDLVIPQEI